MTGMTIFAILGWFALLGALGIIVLTISASIWLEYMFSGIFYRRYWVWLALVIGIVSLWVYVVSHGPVAFQVRMVR